MFHRWAALVLVLALCAMSPKNAAGQTQSQPPRGHGAGKIGSSYPNPFNPDVHILFQVGPEDCTGVSEQFDVKMQIVNVLAQPVVVPVLFGSSAVTTTTPSSLNGAPLSNVKLACGKYDAYWNGKLADGREGASGVYAAQLFVGGRLAYTYKIFYSK